MRILTLILMAGILLVGLQKNLHFAEAQEQPAASTASPEYLTPAIEGHGKVVDPAGLEHLPQADAKVLFEIFAHPEIVSIPPALERVARYLNLAAAAGLNPKDLEVAVVFHGPATASVLSNGAYPDGDNPALGLLQDLHELGVEIYVCTQALAYKNFPLDGVSEYVSPAAAAMTTTVNLQQAGYAYLPD